MVRSYSWKVLLTILVLLASNQLNVDGADQIDTELHHDLGGDNKSVQTSDANVERNVSKMVIVEESGTTDVSQIGVLQNEANIVNELQNQLLIESNNQIGPNDETDLKEQVDATGSQNDALQNDSNTDNEAQQQILIKPIEQIIEQPDGQIKTSERSDSNDSLYQDMGSSAGSVKDLIGDIGQGDLNDSQNDDANIQQKSRVPIDNGGQISNGGLTNGSSSQDTIMNELVDIIEKALLEKNDDKEDSSKSLSPDGNDEKRQKVQENVDDSIHSTQDSDNNQKVSEEVNEIKSQNRKTDVQEKQGDSNDGQDEYKEEIGNKNANQQKNVIVAQDDNVGLHNMTCVLLMLGVIAFVLAVTRLHKPILNWGSLLLAGAVGIGSTIYMNKRRWGGKVSSDYICFVVLFLLLIFVLFMCGFHRDTPNSVDWDKRFKFVDASSPDKILHESASIASCPSHVVYALVTTVMLNALFGWI
eukprot:291062_1